GPAEAHAPRRAVARTRPAPRRGDLPDHPAAQSPGETDGAASRAERGDGPHHRRARLHHGERTDRAGRPGGGAAREPRREGVLPGADRGRGAQVVPRRQALQATETVAQLDEEPIGVSRNATASLGRSERRGGWGAMSRPPMFLGGVRPCERKAGGVACWCWWGRWCWRLARRWRPSRLSTSGVA